MGGVSILSILLALAMLGVLVALFGGIFSMTRGGAFNRRYANRFMRARVLLQLVAVVIFVLLIMVSRG